MKPETIHPRMSSWLTFSADEIADLARENGMVMRGHTFVWHRQTPGWFFASMGSRASREVLLQRLREHMRYMGERYGDVVVAWDVVNEAIPDDPDEYLRPSPYLDIIGEEYIRLAFEIAREEIPDAKLFYDDYSVLDPVKQDKIYRLLSGLIDAGVPVDGIGFQGHWNIYYPDADTLERAIRRFADLGLEIHITELDLSVYRHQDRSRSVPEPTEEILRLQAERYREIFEVLTRNSDLIGNVTFWGVADDSTWLDYYPVRGRKNWPLLFDESHEPKPAFYAVLEVAADSE